MSHIALVEAAASEAAALETVPCLTVQIAVVMIMTNSFALLAYLFDGYF